MTDAYTLMESEALIQRANDDYLLFDCRFSLIDDEIGEQSYAAGHIPGAQYAHLNRQLSGPIIPGKTGRHPLPDKEVFLQQIRRWGITNDSMVVAYDTNGVYASRFWWMLRWMGHAKVVVLNGGIDAWTNAGQSLTQEIEQFPPSSFDIKEPLTRSISVDELPDMTGTLTDARDPARFRGEVEPIDPIAGHIPGATCLPFPANLDGDSWKPAEVLKAQFHDAGLNQGTPVTCYCGSGVSAAHNILALVHAGFPEPALYAGSWSEWITDPARPIAMGT